MNMDSELRAYLERLRQETEDIIKFQGPKYYGQALLNRRRRPKNLRNKKY